MRLIIRELVRRLALYTLILLIGISVSRAQNGDEQKKNIMFSGTHITLGKAMTEIQNQTSYKFAFNPEQIDTSKPVKLTSASITVAEALKQIFGGGEYNYVSRGRFIAVSIDARYAQRANTVAREHDNRPSTSDVYIPNKPDVDTLGRVTKASVAETEYEIERIVTLVPADTIVRVYPPSHSVCEGSEKFINTMSSLPRFAIKTNLLYAAAALAPNISIEIGTRPRETFEMTFGYSSQGRNDLDMGDHKQSAHLIVQPEYRWWSCERYNGQYLGAHMLFSQYYVSGNHVPLLFDKQFSYDGYAVGAGFTYGYQWALAKRWSLEFNVGVGYAYMWYNKGNCSRCNPQGEREVKHYFGPTKAGVNIVFLIK